MTQQDYNPNVLLSIQTTLAQYPILSEKIENEIRENSWKLLSPQARRAAKAVGSILNEIGESLQSFSEQENDGSDSFAEPKKVFYRVRDLNYDPASQIGSYEIYDNAIRACVPGYCVFDQNGTLIYANAMK